MLILFLMLMLMMMMFSKLKFVAKRDAHFKGASEIPIIFYATVDRIPAANPWTDEY
jgi:hypothetical protein